MTILLAVPAEAKAREVLGAWPLDEGSGQVTADRSGKGHLGSLGASSGPDSNDPAWIPGRFGQALRFLGDANQFVAIARPETLAPRFITVEAWVRRLGSPGSWRYILASGGERCSHASYGLYTSSTGGLAFYVTGGDGFVRSPSAAPEAAWDGAWHYAVGTYDGRHVRFYLDGAEVGAGSPTQLAISYGLATRDTYLGTYRAGCDRPFTGDIDEVVIRDGALGADDVAAQAAAAGPLAGPPQLPPVAGPPARSGCYTVRIAPRRLVAQQRTRLRITVRRLGRAAPRMRVTLRGAGVRASVRTGQKGRAGLRVRPKRRGRLKVAVVGQPRRCSAARLKVRPARR